MNNQHQEEPTSYLFHNNEPLSQEEREHIRQYHLGNITPENEKLFQSIHVRRGSGPVYWYIPYHYLFMERNLQYQHKRLNGGKVPSAYWVRRKIKHAFQELGLGEEDAQKHFQYDSRHHFERVSQTLTDPDGTTPRTASR